MRNIINMIIKIAIIWGAAWMFPEYVKIQDTRTDVLLIGTQGTVQRLLQDEQTGQIYPINNVFVSIINNAMVEEDKGEYTVTEPLFNPFRGILWKNNVCKLRAHFRTDDKNIKVLKSLKGVDITPEVPEE